MEVFPYIHPPFKIATSQSNGLGMKNVVELCASDVSCHDLAKWLSYYLYFFSFSFLFLLDLQLQDGVWESIT